MTYYANDRRQTQVAFSSLTIVAVIAAILSIFVITRTSACTVENTSSHHQLLK
jgi:hypothetical protein